MHDKAECEATMAKLKSQRDGLVREFAELEEMVKSVLEKYKELSIRDRRG